MLERRKKNSNIFRVLRSCMGISLNEMAERCGVSAVYLNELEREKKTKPSEDTLKKIADACGLKLSTLQFFIDEKQGQSLDYQLHLLSSLELYAQSNSTIKTDD